MLNWLGGGKRVFICIIWLSIAQGCAEETERATVPHLDAEISVDAALPMNTDMGTPEFELTESDSTPLTLRTITEQPVQRIWSLADQSIVWENGTGLTQYVGGMTNEILQSNVNALEIISVNGQLLASTNNGLLVIRDNGFSPSPIGEALPPNCRLLSIDGNAFWALHRGGILHWRDGILSTVYVGPIETEALTAFSGVEDGHDQIVLWQGDAARRFSLRGTEITDSRISFDAFPLSVGLNPKGLWVMTDTHLFNQTHDESWRYTALPNGASEMRTSGVSDAIYLLSPNQIWRLKDQKLTNIERPTDIRYSQVRPDGSLLIQTDSDLAILSTERSGDLIGLHAGPLVQDTSIEVLLSNTDGIRESTWSMDDELLDQEGRVLTLSPRDISPGMHELNFIAHYEDGDTVNITQEFEGPPSWTDHIKPISESRCLNCHSAGAQTELEQMNQWIDRFDSVQYNVETERMPLTPDKLSETELNFIKGWGLAGFPHRETP